MRTLCIPRTVFYEIVRSVCDGPTGCETGVTLFGWSLAESSHASHVVLAIAGPGRRATYEPAHYSGDESHANEIFDSLRSALPGIRWLGELHVHPRGMTWLSQGDLRTVRHILTGTDQTLHPDEFIAGVMQRRNGTVEIYPFHFTRECLKGSAMELRIVNSDAPEVKQARRNAIEQREEQDDRRSFRTESQRGRAALREARGLRGLWQWWRRHRPYGRALGHRQIHPS